MHPVLSNEENEFRSQSERFQFEAIFNQYYRTLSYFAARFVEDRDAAEDIVMDAFVRLWQKGSDLASRDTCVSFLYSAIRHACIDLLRQQKRREISKAEIAYLSNKQERYVLEEMIRAEVVQQLYMAMNALPPKMRAVFQLFYLEGKSIKEIAQELNVSVNTIKTQKARALQLLKEKLPYITILFLVFQFM